MASQTFFPRGNGPLVSVLIPSRGRPAQLRRAVESTMGLTADGNNVEFLVRADEDDVETIKMLRWLEAAYPLRSVVGPRGEGYRGLHYYINELAAQSKGDWLLLFCDDAEMVTQDWDEKILRTTTWNKPLGIQDICLLNLEQEDNPASYSFVALRRRAYQLLGCFSKKLHCDLWLYQLMQSIDMVIKCHVKVRHFNVEDDPTGLESIVASRGLWREMKTPNSVYQRLSLAEKLVDWMDYQRLQTRWKKQPDEGGGWHWWRQSGTDCERPMYAFGEDGTVYVDSISKVVHKGEALGPEIGSDRKSHLFCVSEMGGEWSAIG